MFIREKSFQIIITTILILISLIVFLGNGKTFVKSINFPFVGDKTIEDVEKEIGKKIDKKLKPYFKKAEVSYPPSKIAFLVFKKEKILELWAIKQNKWAYIRSYPVLAASGKSGPKLKEGDRQVPEGIYDIIVLNPNSYFHFAMLINYPNDFDIGKAEKEGRTNLGGDICIHGDAVSIGCIAVGDEAIEELFIIVNHVGMENVKVVIAPWDFRKKAVKIDKNTKITWLPELYKLIDKELKNYHKD